MILTDKQLAALKVYGAAKIKYERLLYLSTVADKAKRDAAIAVNAAWADADKAGDEYVAARDALAVALAEETSEPNLG